MNKLFIFFYSLSVVVTIIIFGLVNYLTEPLLIETSNNIGISNGNAGLFPIIFLAPFLIVLIIGTYKIANTFAQKSFHKIQFKIIMIISFIAPCLIFYFTFKKAEELRLLIFNNTNSVTKINEIPLLNSYSNNIFFNGWTLLSLIFTIIFVAFCFALLFKTKKAPENL